MTDGEAREMARDLVRGSIIEDACAQFIAQILKHTHDERVKPLQARAERIEAAASAVADDVCEYICPSIGLAGRPIPHDPRCIALRAALKGADHD